ncbi:MAG: twin-arginine translocase TatA/TatE family subunit [Pseudomonadota bacterium]
MSIGIWQVVLILLIVLIVFGAGKLPKVMGDVAKGVKNFKQGMREDVADDDEDEKSKVTPSITHEEPSTVRRSDAKDEVAKS